MSFVSLQFLIFLPTVLLLHFLLPHKLRWIVLLAASYYAYMSWNVLLVLPILATTLISYLAAIICEKSGSKKIKKAVLALALVICLGTLAFFKYFNFLLDSVVAFLNLFALDLSAPVFDILLPVGISFYTFQTLSYVIDVYRGKAKAEKHFGYYALYVSFFPQLVAGPIERPETLLPQLKEKRKVSADDMAKGFATMAVGFFRKCVVADFIGTFVSSVFADLSAASGLAVAVAAGLFLVQIYCDFAGYSEIAVGAARMLGIKLSRNFDRPLCAVSVRDFMRRWHITLNTWFKDYLYIPLGGSRKGKARQVLNVMIVYILCGLWHGANWTFVLWGLYMGVLVCIESLLKKPFGRFKEKFGFHTSKQWVTVVRRIALFLILIPGGIFFRSQSIADIGLAFERIFVAPGFGPEYFAATLSTLGMKVLDIARIALTFFCMTKLDLMCDFTQYKPEALSSPTGTSETLVGEGGTAENGLSVDGGSEAAIPLCKRRGLYARKVSAVFYILTAVALAWIAVLAGGGLGAFVYFQF